ncbi:ANTAR domain-containing response regulator [Kineothrix sp. MB12-C1]|uniref:ANTAR domain-containing response regulator n=1 Tax=Kineothrix sp. MB12-C1 TaxID=3070215 RepID=UPI0027D27AE1|nr:ANTAR domain-containing protein [Kineothrix sp. MB12-C1]WMC93353.1 ANTAR domain-containing protein [Kineothrix sp. MB12-C1]
MSIIIVALPKIEDAKKIRKILIQHGFENTVACTTAAQVLSEVNKGLSGLVISSYKLPDMYYGELNDLLPEFFELLLIGSPSVVSSAEISVMAVTIPIRTFELINTVEMQLRQIGRRLKKEKKKGKIRSEQDENYIKNAKLLLMERNHLTEEEAYSYIQKCSMDSATNMVETAQMILTLIYDEI